MLIACNELKICSTKKKNDVKTKYQVFVKQTCLTLLKRTLITIYVNYILWYLFLLNSIPLSKSFDEGDPLYPRLSVVKRRHSGI